MTISRNSPFAFAPPESALAPTPPNDITFGLLGPQAPGKQPQMGWGPGSAPPLAPKVSRAGPGPGASAHFLSKKVEKHRLVSDFFGTGASRRRAQKKGAPGALALRCSSSGTMR